MNKCEKVQQAIEKNPTVGEKIINRLIKKNQIQKDWIELYKNNVSMYAEEISLELLAAEAELGKELIKIK